MNWRRGFVRLWLVCSLLWLGIVLLLLSPFADRLQPLTSAIHPKSLEAATADWSSRAALLLLPPLLLLFAGLLLSWFFARSLRLLWLVFTGLWVLGTALFCWSEFAQPLRDRLPLGVTNWLDYIDHDQVGVAALMLGVPFAAAALVWVAAGFRRKPSAAEY